MKKITKLIFSGLCLLAVAANAVACSTGKNEISGLPYFNGVAEDMSYDTDIFYRNDLLVSGADPDVIWISENQDRQNGGWFYMYCTSTNFRCLRSKNLVDWELIGPSLSIEDEQLPSGTYWAPEVVYNRNYDENADRDDLNSYRYFMYFSAEVKQGALDNYNSVVYKRLYIFLAVSDSPSGPFKLYKDEPVLNLRKAAQENLIDCDALRVTDDFNFGTIDADPFFDDDGNMYLYFSSSEEQNGNCVYGVKLTDPCTADYSTLTKLLQPKKLTVDGEDFGYESKYMLDGGAINEGPFMLKHNGKYYLMYSPFSYTNRMYSVCTAIADSPLGCFTKVSEENGNPVLGIEAYMEHMGGTGHASFVTVGDELFAVYHAHQNRAAGKGNPRAVAIDRCTFIYNENLGCDMIYANGPTYSLQPLPSAVSGYKNIISEATVTATNCDKDTVKYLTDGLITTNYGTANYEFSAKGETEITIKFSSPKTIKAVMVYNSFNYEYAFSGLKRVELTFAEKPDSYIGTFNKIFKIQNIPFNDAYVNTHGCFMNPGGASVVEFGEAKITEIKIVISDSFDTTNSEIRVSDIAVLGV